MTRAILNKTAATTEDGSVLAWGAADGQGVVLDTLSNVVPNVGSELLALSRVPSNTSYMYTAGVAWHHLRTLDDVIISYF